MSSLQNQAKVFINSKLLTFLRIDDIAFELFAKHCGIGRGIRQKKISQENVVNITN